MTDVYLACQLPERPIWTATDRDGTVLWTGSSLAELWRRAAGEGWTVNQVRAEPEGDAA